MINLKREILIALLNQDSGLRSRELAELLNVTPRTIRNNIKEINQSFQLNVIQYKKPFFYLSNTHEVIKYITFRNQEVHYPNYINDRPFLVYFTIYKRKLIKVQTLSSILHIGRNEIEESIKYLKKIGPTYKIEIEASKNGIYLKGKQIWKDFLLALLSIKRINRLINNQYLRIMFDQNFDKKKFLNYLIQLSKNILETYKVKASDNLLYILTVMHFLNLNHQKIQPKDYSQFCKEFILFNNNLILQVVKNIEYQNLIKIYPSNKQFIIQGTGNIINHLVLANSKPKYFKPTIKFTNLHGFTLKHTDLDNSFINSLNNKKKFNIGKRVVIYDSNILSLSKYQDEILPLISVFPELEIKVTNNLFELSSLLHIKNKQIIFIAKKERITLDDQNFNIHFLKLKNGIIKDLTQVLTQ